MRIVIKLTFLHPTPINKLFLYLINSHILELTGIQRRLSDRWLNGHIVRLLNLLALVRLTLLIVNSKVIACQILSRNPFDIINRYSHDDIFIIQYLIDIPLIDKGILQKVGLKVIGFHTQVKIPTHTGFDGLHNPWFKIALGYLPNSLQQLLFNTFVGFKTPLIIIIRRNTGNNISSLFTKCHGRPIIDGRVIKADKELLTSCYRSCLELAAENGLESVAFCCISTGEFHFPNEQAAQIAVETVKEFLKAQTSVKKVIFNVFKDLDKAIYEKLLGAA